MASSRPDEPRELYQTPQAGAMLRAVTDAGIREGRVETAEPQARADWGRVEGAYRQICSIINDRDATYLPDVISGHLAQVLGRVFSNYHGREPTLAGDVRLVFSRVDEDAASADDAMLRLYFDQRLIGLRARVGGPRFSAYSPRGAQRRRPTPFEAALETCRRVRDLDRAQRALQPVACAAVLGGSLSYGRFMNVRGANWGRTKPTRDPVGSHCISLEPRDDVPGDVEPEKASDTDLVLILDDYRQLDDVADCLARLVGTLPEDVADLRRRVDAFKTLKVGESRMFSHKLPLWRGQPDPMMAGTGLLGAYVLSLHVFSRDELDHLLLTSRPVIAFESRQRHVESMWDFRPDWPGKRFDQQRSFAGSELRLPRPSEETAHGYLAKSAVCVVRKGRYHPGMYQNLMIPLFDTLWDAFPEPVSPRLEAFRWKVVERLRSEKRRWPNEKLQLSLSHTRSELFAPHVVLGLDEGRIL